MEVAATQPHTLVAAQTHEPAAQPTDLVVEDDGPTPRKASWPPPPNPVAILSGIAEEDKIRCQEISGSFSDHVMAKQGCNSWSLDRTKQPDGIFQMVAAHRTKPTKQRGDRRYYECKRCIALRTPEEKADPTAPRPVVASLEYEQLDDNQYYLGSAQLKHAEGCLKPTNTAAQDRAEGLV